MKTAREWFETFPEHYRSQALNNCSNSQDEYKNYSDALLYDFSWSHTREGDKYWNEFHDELLKKNQ